MQATIKPSWKGDVPNPGREVGGGVGRCGEEAFEDSGLILGVDDKTSPYLAVKVSSTRVGCTIGCRILS